MFGTRPRILSTVCFLLVIIGLLAGQVLTASAAAGGPTPILKSIAATMPLNADRAADIQQVDVVVPQICFLRTLTSPVVITEGDPNLTFAIVFSNYANPIGVTIVSQDETQLVGDPASFTDIIRSLINGQNFEMRAIDDAIDEADAEYTLTLVFSGGSACESIELASRTVTFRILDNDPPAVTVVAQDADAAEAGTDPGTFRITRTAGDTSADLTVEYTIGGTADSADYTPTLTGTATIPAGETFVDVTITPVDDAVDEADPETVTLTLTDTAAYELGASSSATVNIADNDSAGVTITETSGTPNDNALSVTEGSGTTSFSVVLNSQPTSNVEVSMTFNDTLIQAGSPTPGGSPVILTFTPGNWNVAQTVAVAAVDNSVVTGGAVTNLSLVSGSADPNYIGAPFKPVSPIVVTVIEDDVPGVTITETSGTPNDNALSVTEGSGTTSFSVVLNSQPTSDVEVSMTFNDTLIQAGSPTPGGSPAILTFTPGNWNSPQTVAVAAVDNSVVTGGAVTNLSLVSGSADPNYIGAPFSPASPIVVTVVEDDVPGVTVTETGGSTAVSESGTTDSFTVVLNTQPTADVIIDLVSTDMTEATVSPLQLTFTAANWNVAQPVTVTGVDDPVADGAQPFTITTTLTSADALYAVINPADVSGTNADNDAAGVTVTETGGSTAVTESGTTDSFTLVLNTEPTADVIIDLASTDMTEATVSPLQLTFTAANWNVAQAVTVTGVDDPVADGAQPFTITTTLTSADALYAAINPADVSGTNADNDTAGVTVTETGGGTAVTEGGTTDTFTVVLTSQPTADVSIALTGSQVTTGAPALTFTPANWNTAQAVTVTAVDDAIAEGTHAGSVSFTVTSADALYNGAALAPVSVTITDNETASVLIAPLAITLTEGSAGAASIVLTAPPSAGSVSIPVTFDPVNLALNGESDGVVELVFTAANWNVPVGLTIAALANGTPDDARLSMIGFQISASGAPEYPIGPLPAIQVTIADVPPPPPTPLCEAHNFDEGGVVRSSIADALGHAINCRILYQNGASTTWLGGALYSEANLGVPGLLELGVLQAVDIFSPGGQTYFEGGAVFCLRGQGTLIWLAASGAPRVPAIIGSYTVPEHPGFTCATLFEPGTLVLVADNPVD